MESYSLIKIQPLTTNGSIYITTKTVIVHSERVNSHAWLLKVEKIVSSFTTLDVSVVTQNNKQKKKDCVVVNSWVSEINIKNISTSTHNGLIYHYPKIQCIIFQHLWLSFVIPISLTFVINIIHLILKL